MCVCVYKFPHFNFPLFNRIKNGISYNSLREENDSSQADSVRKFYAIKILINVDYFEFIRVSYAAPLYLFCVFLKNDLNLMFQFFQSVCVFFSICMH